MIYHCILAPLKSQNNYFLNLHIESPMFCSKNKFKNVIKYFFAVLLTAVFFTRVFSQTTPEVLNLSLKDLDKIFLEKNLALIVSKANVDINRAYKNQSLLWDNPQISTEIGSFNFAQSGYNDVGFSQVYGQVTQLIKLAQKRQKLADISEFTAQFSEAQFYDLMRALKHQLHADFYDLASVETKLKWYSEQVAIFDKIIDANRTQFKAGNVAEKEVIRLLAQRVQLQHDAAELDRSRIALNTDLKTLLASKNEIVVKPLLPQQNLNTTELVLADLINFAITNRPDNKAAALNTQIQEKNVVYQKSLAVPDVTLGLSFSRTGSYINNYLGVNAGIPLPILNKNQFNIKAAELSRKQQEAQQEAVSVQVSSDIVNAYRKLLDLQRWKISEAAQAYTDYEKFYNQNVVTSFEKRLITLIEFIDYFQTYQQNKFQTIDNDLQTIQAAETLEFVVGKELFNK